MSGERTTPGCVLAIDPGSAKCGVAVVQSDRAVLHRSIVTTAVLAEEIRALAARYQPRSILIGAGTGSRPMIQALEALHLDIGLHMVDEAHTSEAARARFVAENTPVGWQRLLPRSLRTPTRPYDDYVAVILAERFWQSAENKAAVG